MTAFVMRQAPYLAPIFTGIFDYGDLAALVVIGLMRKKGLDPGSWHFDPEAHKEQEYDKLAELVRSSMDMDKIYEILEAGITC